MPQYDKSLYNQQEFLIWKLMSVYVVYPVQFGDTYKFSTLRAIEKGQLHASKI